MRKQLVATGMLLAITGCAMPSIPGMSTLTAQKADTQPPALAQSAPKPQGPSFTEKYFGWVPGVSNSEKQPLPRKPESYKNDPISLGYRASAPPTPELYVSMAQLSEQGSKTEHARAMYQQALSLDPKNLDALMGLARMEDREGKLEEALSIYCRAVSMYPKNAKVLNDLALCHARSGQLNHSRQLLSQAIALQPDKALYRNNIAKVLVEMNRVDDAVTHLAAVHPPAVAQYNVGVMLQGRGRTDEAIRFLTAASHIDPQLQAAREMLQQLQGNTNALATNDSVLPTPMTQPASATTAVGGYPSTGMVSQRPLPVAFPAETAQVPVGNSPSMLPPVR